MDKGDIKEGLTFNHFIGINIPGPLACTIPTSAGLLAESASTSGIEAREAPVLLVLITYPRELPGLVFRVLFPKL